MPHRPEHPERARAFAMPLDQIDVSKGYLFEQDLVGFYFERLRRDDPVHHVVSKRFGPYWSPCAASLGELGVWPQPDDVLAALMRLAAQPCPA